MMRQWKTQTVGARLIMRHIARLRGQGGVGGGDGVEFAWSSVDLLATRIVGCSGAVRLEAGGRRVIAMQSPSLGALCICCLAQYEAMPCRTQQQPPLMLQPLAPCPATQFTTSRLAPHPRADFRASHIAVFPPPLLPLPPLQC